MSFKKDFVWGAATASYQVEGAAYEDGKGLNIWDVFSHQPDRVFEGHTGDIACDQYHKYKEDIAIMKELNIPAYRFSISWARIFPDGTGRINPAGLEYYNNLINELLAKDIIPYITLYHWDLPYELHKKGGWLNSDIVGWFSEYASIVAENFSDRAVNYFTLNEPQCFIGLGNMDGVHAPGFKASARDGLQMMHNALKAHGAAVQALRASAKRKLNIGYAPTGVFHYPATDSKEDIEAAKEAVFNIPDNPYDFAWSVPIASDPVYLGKYPEEMYKKYEKHLPKITDSDLKLISQPLDFMGQNIYNGHEVRMGKDGKPEIVKRYEGFPKTALNWPVTPKSLYWGAKFLCERYKLPLYITENGLSCHDTISLDGKVHDANRIDFYQRYLRELKEAAKDGADIAGYFAWSLMDNFEWHSGYSERFGLVFVDYTTQQRIIKDSGYWYKTVINSNGDNL